MRLVFTKLETPLKNILVDVGNGKYEEFEVNNLQESSSAKYIQLPNTIPANLIRVKASSAELASLNMIKDYMITDDEGNVLGSWSLTAGTSTGVLSANETRYNYDVVDKYKILGKDIIYHIVLSDTADFKFIVNETYKSFLENNNGQKYEFENIQIPGMYFSMFMLAHNNILYAIVPTFDDSVENILSAELRKINMSNMNVEYSIDVSEYFAGSMEEYLSLGTYLPAMNGNILSEDKPVIAITNTNKYIDLVSGDIRTREQNFISGNTYYLSKTDTWYELPGNLGTETSWTTNNKYASIEDAALIDTPYLENDNYIFDAPFLGLLEGVVKWTNSGVLNELSIGEKGFFYRDENNNKIIIIPGGILFNDIKLDATLYNNYGYVVNKYVNITPYQVEKVKIDRTQADFTDVPITADKATIGDIETEVVKAVDAEFGGMFFYEGEWYHKRMYTKTELLEFIKNNTENKNFKILFDGKLNFYDSDFPEKISSSDIVGTYQVYRKDKNNIISLYLVGTANLMYNAYDLLNVIEFYNFTVELSFEGLQNMNCLHLNDSSIKVANFNNLEFGQYYSRIFFERCNNVEVSLYILDSSVQITLKNCTNIKVNDEHNSNKTFEVTISDSDRCYVGLASDNITYKQRYAGYNVVMNIKTDTQIQPTWY